MAEENKKVTAEDLIMSIQQQFCLGCEHESWMKCLVCPIDTVFAIINEEMGIENE